jgi:cyclopropane fatty-acyl-phospholipid synthase-like methyltransferase
MKELWNQRYSLDEYKYGKEPNQFFKEELTRLKPGRILLPGEGEGRNAVYAAASGWEVDAFDFSEAGKIKALKLAEESGAKINYDVKEFSEFRQDKVGYDAAAIIFIHLEEDQRRSLFEKIIASLKPGGKIIFECFEKDQIKFQSGGPKDIALLYTLEDVVNLFIDLEFEKLTKEKIFLNEGKGHLGEGIVIRFIGTKQ